MRFLLLAWATILGLSGFAFAAELEILIVAEGHNQADIEGIVVLQSANGFADRNAVVQVNTPSIIDLEPGEVWSLTTTFEDYWAPAETLFVPEGGASITIGLLPTGVVEGSVVMVPKGTVPEDLGVRFAPSASNVAVGEEVTCPIRDQRFACSLPVGSWDLRVRAKAFVSSFFWSVEVVGDKPSDLGQIRLRRGASVVGVVETEEGTGIDGSCSVRLASQTAGLNNDESKRLAVGTLTAKPDERGFFHIVGVPPGRYVLTADQPGYAQTRLYPVDVFEHAETALLHGITLSKPLTLDLSLIPTTDPYDQPWEISLVEESGHQTVQHTPVSRAQIEGGLWSRPAMRPGRYTVMIFDSQGSVWKMEDFELQTGHQYLDLEIPMVDVEGEVRINDEVVPVEVVFESTATDGFKEDTTSIVLISDGDGVIRGILPYEGTYNVVIETTEPLLKRRVRGVEVEQISSSSLARFVIELPETEVNGVVVDREGRPESGAMVMCQNADDPRDRSAIGTDDDGRFQLLALEHGRYLVHATSDERRSREMNLEIDDSETPELELILEDSSELTGRVVSLGGSGVAGASIMAGGPGFTSGGQAVAGVDGSFSLPVPERIKTVVFIVQAPGYGLQTKSVNVEGDQETVLHLTQVGAGLTLTGLAKPHERGETVFLLHDGGFLAEAILRMWAAVNGVRSTDQDRLEIPMLEPGSYQVCVAGMDVLAVLQGFFSEQEGSRGFECEEVYLHPRVETTMTVPQ